MAVEDVNNPKTVTKVDPRAATGQGEGTAAYWKNKADEARARHDYLAEEEAMKMLGRAAPEPAFQIKGSVDLGQINPQQAAREAQERADKLIESKDNAIKEANAKATEAENNLNKERIEGIRRDFATQMEGLQKTIKELGTAKDARPLHEQFKEQYTSVLGLAKDLGLEKTNTGRDPMVDIKLAEMSYENARKEREFQLELTERDRRWQLDLQELKDKREHNERLLEVQAKRDQMLFSAPATIGAAIAKGLAGVSQEGGAPSGAGIQDRPGGPQAYKLQAVEGESGEFACPHCNTLVGVGPNSDLAECISCNTKFNIERVPATAAAEAEEEK